MNQIMNKVFYKQVFMPSVYQNDIKNKLQELNSIIAWRKYYFGIKNGNYSTLNESPFSDIHWML